MTGRIQHLLLVALFAAAHLIVQPLATTGWCMGAVEMGGQCCCSPESAPSTSPVGCCGSSAPSDDEPADSEGYDSGCHCFVTPPAPALPAQEPSTVVDGDKSSKAVAAESDRLQAGVWPCVTVRAARPPNQPPRVVRKATPVFTQVYRL